MKKVNLLCHSKYSPPLSGLPLPAWLQASASALSLSFRPVVATSFRTDIGAAQSSRFTPRLAPSRHNTIGSLLGSRRGIRSPTDTKRAPTKTPPSSLKKENSREFSPILRSGDSSVQNEKEEFFHQILRRNRRIVHPLASCIGSANLTNDVHHLSPGVTLHGRILRSACQSEIPTNEAIPARVFSGA